jgi:hypothetical protein
MAKKFRRLQRISTIPILAALLLASNPAALADRPQTNDTVQTGTAPDTPLEIQDISDSRLRTK